MDGWVPIVSVIVAALFGTGGFAAMYKARSDAKQGISDDARAEADAVNARALAVIDVQVKYLLEPLQQEVTALRIRVEKLVEELEERKDRYWDAITFIRALSHWIIRHMPEDDDRPPPPAPPATLAEDI